MITNNRPTVPLRVLRPGLVALLAPLFLAACIFDELIQERTDLVFEDEGTIRYTMLAKGVLSSEFLDAPEEEWADMFAYAEEMVEGMTYGWLDPSSLSVSLRPLSQTEAELFVDGRYYPKTDAAEASDGRITFWFQGSNYVNLVLNPELFDDSPAMLCIEIEGRWTASDSLDELPKITDGEEDCIDLQALHRAGFSYQVIFDR